MECGYYSGHCPRCLRLAEYLDGTAFCPTCRIYCRMESGCTTRAQGEEDLAGATLSGMDEVHVDDWILLETCGGGECMSAVDAERR
jgi:hypothetical protein